MRSENRLSLQERAHASALTDFLPPHVGLDRLTRLVQGVQQVRGRILLVQEERFQVETEEGRRLNFILKHDARVDWQTLDELVRTQRPVEVSFQPALQVSALQACAIDELPEFETDRLK